MRGVIIAVLLASSMLLPGCGGDTNEEVALEEYFLRLEGISHGTNTTLDLHEESFSEQLMEELSAEQELDAFRLFVTGFIMAFEDAAEEMDDIDPPAEVEDAHNTFVDAVTDSAQSLSDFRDPLEDLESVSDWEELRSEFDEVASPLGEGIADACLALQVIAEDNGIDADLECER